MCSKDKEVIAFLSRGRKKQQNFALQKKHFLSYNCQASGTGTGPGPRIGD